MMATHKSMRRRTARSTQCDRDCGLGATAAFRSRHMRVAATGTATAVFSVNKTPVIRISVNKTVPIVSTGGLPNCQCRNCRTVMGFADSTSRTDTMFCFCTNPTRRMCCTFHKAGPKSPNLAIASSSKQRAGHASTALRTARQRVNCVLTPQLRPWCRNRSSCIAGGSEV